MNQGQVSLKFLQLIEAAMRAGALATPSLGLYTNPAFVPSVTNVLVDLIQPTYTGYALAVLAIAALRSNANSDQIDTFGTAHFQPTGGTGLPQTVYGAFLQATITATDFLLQTTPFSTPFVFTGVTDGLDVIPEVIFPNLAVYGGICTTCP
jgi:hypothetical protein